MGNYFHQLAPFSCSINSSIQNKLSGLFVGFAPAPLVCSLSTKSWKSSAHVSYFCHRFGPCSQHHSHYWAQNGSNNDCVSHLSYTASWHSGPATTWKLTVSFSWHSYWCNDRACRTSSLWLPFNIAAHKASGKLTQEGKTIIDTTQ